MYGQQRSGGTPLTVSIPAGYPVGAIFGKAGSNFQRLIGLTRGGRVHVDAQRMQVTVDGVGAEAVIADLNRHFAAHARKGAAWLESAERAIGSYPHPEVIKQIFTKVDAAETLMEFTPFGTALEVAGRSKDQVYTLGRASPAEDRAGSPTPGSLSGAFAGLGLRKSPVEEHFLLASALPACESELLTAAAAGRAFEPSFDSLRLRINLGKQFFYPPRRKQVPADSLSFSAMQGLEVGYDKDIKAVYSNGLDDEQSRNAIAKLLLLNFSQQPPQDVVSLHLTDDEQGTSCMFTFHLESDGIRLGKMKSGNALLIIIAYLADKTVDFRSKVMGQYYFCADSTEAVRMRKLAEGCQIKEGHLKMPQDSRGMQGFSWKCLRYNTKTKFSGTYTDSRGTLVPVCVNVQKLHSIESVENGGSNTHHNEVVILAPLLDVAFKSRASDGAAVHVEEQAKILHALVEFCQELQSAVLM